MMKKTWSINMMSVIVTKMESNGVDINLIYEQCQRRQSDRVVTSLIDHHHHQHDRSPLSYLHKLVPRR